MTRCAWTGPAPRRLDRVRSVLRRPRTLIVVFVALAAIAALLAAPAAIAADGEGWYGRTDDKVVTFVALGVIGFFVAFVIVMSAVQAALERRKDERKAAELRKRVGW